MSAATQKAALGLGLVVGLVVSGVTVFVKSTGGSGGPALRPDGVPPEAVWHDNAFGAPGWIHCAPVEAKVACKGYGPHGDLLVSATYVARSGAGPSAPFTHVVAHEVDEIWLNKVALVADGAAELSGGITLQYSEGKRLTDPSL